MQPFNRKIVPRRVPIGGFPKVDWTHPLARGLVGCWLPGISGIDLSGNCPPLTLSQAGGAIDPKGLGVEGPALTGAVSGVGGNIMSCTAPAVYKNWNNFSLYYRGPRGTGDGGGILSYFFYISYDNAVNSPYTLISIGDSNNSAINTVGTEWNDGVGNDAKGTSTIDLRSNKLVSVLGTFTVNGSVLLYSDGAKVGAGDSWGSASQAASTATSQIQIGGWLATGRYTPTWCNIACAWNRALSATEAALLDRNPYAFLVMPSMSVGVTAAATQYAAFSTPQYDGRVTVTMTGY